MERNQLRPEQQDELLPVQRGTLPPTVQQRAPTLMAGEAPGEQGKVEVWSPDRWRLTLVGAAYLVTIVGYLFTMVMNWYIAMTIFCISFYLLTVGMSSHYWLAACKRPRYLTTDEAGMGITMQKGSRAVGWRDLRSARLSGDILILKVKEQTVIEDLEVNLKGYPKQRQKALMDLVIKKAGLEQHPNEPGRFVSEEERPLWKRLAERKTPGLSSG